MRQSQSKKLKPLPVGFPQTVYIRREFEGDEAYLVTFEDLDELDNKNVVGVYVLEGVKKITKSTTLS